ncbi:MAG: class I fructose-bisphosphate aldolase [Bacillota bacterium]
MGKRRLERVFRSDGRSLIVAMDHPSNCPTPPELERPDEAIAKVVEGGADAVILNHGAALRFSSALRGRGLIYRLDLSPTTLAGGRSTTWVFDVETALELGADAVIASGCLGEGLEHTLDALGKIGGDCQRWGLPLIAEMLPGGFDGPPELKNVANLRMAVRVAGELGADVVKAPYVPGYEEVIAASYLPVVVLGGVKTKDARAFLDSIADALRAGAAGVAIGRNVWGHPSPTAMTRALNAIIHEGRGADEAARHLG